jgi:hypothetical protein
MGEGQPEADRHADRRDRQRLTVSAAATVLGVTVDAVRGRIRRGKLASEHDENGTVYVWVDAPESPEEQSRADRPEPSPTVVAEPGPSADQSELVEVLKAQLDAEREANRENRRIIAALASRIPEIEPPREAPSERRESSTRSAEDETGGEGAEVPKEGTDAPMGEARTSWWRRFFGFE